MIRTERRLARTVAFILTVAAALALGAPAANGDASGDASQFFADTNMARAAHATAPLSLDASLTSVAQAWSNHMAAVGGISHNPSLAQFRAEPWALLGENVGMGYSVASLQQAFLNSPMHYRNIVDPVFTLVGVAVAYGLNNEIFVTLDFLAPLIPSAPPASPVPVTVHPSSSGVRGPTVAATPPRMPAPATQPARAPQPARATPRARVSPTVPAVAASWWRLADLGLLPRGGIGAGPAAVGIPISHEGPVTLPLPIAVIGLVTTVIAALLAALVAGPVHRLRIQGAQRTDGAARGVSGRTISGPTVWTPTLSRAVGSVPIHVAPPAIRERAQEIEGVGRQR
jgi:hypothetical protein